VSYCDVEEGEQGVAIDYSCCILNWETGNKNIAPCFVELGLWDPNGTFDKVSDDAITFGDYHLRSDSPCIDAGDLNSISEPNETDLDGRSRILGGQIDIGAYEYQNNLPFASAGAEQMVYAWIDGFADVTLDGSDSNDPDCNELTYFWGWTIDGNDYEANGVNPTVELPVGVHTIQLVVNDGYVDSVPDDVNITVVATLEGRLNIVPSTINRWSNQPHILAVIELDGIAKSGINADELLTLYPGGIKAMKQWLFTSKDRLGKLQTTIFVFLDKDALMAAVPENGDNELKVAGKLKSGQYFYGCDTVKIIGPKWQRP